MAFEKPPVARSPDFDRVVKLPVRGPGSYPPNLVQIMTDLLKTPEGTMTLLEVQARALYDFGTHGRAFLPIGVGRGKTLISLLAPRVVESKRPILITKASLIEKTKRDWRALAKHFKVAKHLRFYSYEFIGRAGKGAVMFDTIKPDLIILDEGHKAKNPRAACTRRLTRYIEKERPRVLPMSGTFMKDSVENFGHLAEWSLREGSPLPLNKYALAEWAGALDEGLNVMNKRSPGVLLYLMPGFQPPESKESDDPWVCARQVFQARAQATPGWVSAGSTDDYEGSLEIDAIEYSPNAATEANFEKLRSEKCRPDGWALSDAMQEWRVARELSLGLHYTWNPLPPEEWLDARKQYAQFVREFLKTPASARMEIDSEFQVMNGILSGKIFDEYGVLDHWREVKPTFDVNSVPVWHDESALVLCASWLRDHPKGICWVEHRFFGNELSKRTGIPYFREKGLDPTGKFIDDHDGPCIASVASNIEGRDLQHKWCDNLITAPPADSERWEQLMARTHRRGQKEDTVQVDVLVGCREHLESVPRALSSADVKKDLLGARAKIALADINWPDTSIVRKGFRWT